MSKQHKCVLNRTSPSPWLQVTAWRRLENWSSSVVSSLKSNQLFLVLVNHSCKFHPYPSELFLVILLTVKQTVVQTDTGENITGLQLQWQSEGEILKLRKVVL